MASSSTGEKPRVLVLGGCGFIGRNLVHYLVSKDLAAKIRVADKTPPQMAWMNDKHKEAIESVDFVSVNLINPGSVSKAFSDGDDSYDIVVNLAAETQYGRADVIYEEGIVKLSQNCAREAAARNVKKYIEISTGQVYSSDKKSSKEDSSKLSPWTGIAKCKLQVEEELKKVDGLNYCVLRPATVYGLGDKYGLTPRLIIGAVYRQLGEKMELLWSADLGMHTVHVDDVCQAIWHVAEKAENGQVFNVVDKSSTTQGSISDLVCQIFDIKYGFLGTALTKIAELSNRDIAEFCNDKHTEPWSEACKLDKIEHTPLSPYLDAELLYHKHMLLDGSKLDATGFTHLRPKLTKEALKEMVDDFVKIGVFPKSLVPS
ncbi:uncharacterized protein LOC587197 [Strongylocentrotus purpuratus]|uniref:NAD-dependent epimerase/dehydratase domain-containing protein n=1 Tax=Strongylocentrotus purpuratus TaxID=7668 RepID=A0A7M7PV01_STRPU|nr:uncharacterized protein LOC587197 [Strongylocentrotus purpuratus]